MKDMGPVSASVMENVQALVVIAIGLRSDGGNEVEKNMPGVLLTIMGVLT